MTLTFATTFTLVLVTFASRGHGDLPPKFVDDLVTMESDKKMVNCLAMVGSIDDDDSVYKMAAGKRAMDVLVG